MLAGACVCFLLSETNLQNVLANFVANLTAHITTYLMLTSTYSLKLNFVMLLLLKDKYIEESESEMTFLSNH